MRSRLGSIVGMLLAAAASLQAADGQFDKTIAFPRGGEVKLDWAYQKCVIQSVKVVGYPATFEIEKARREDPNDHSSIAWEFAIDNRSSEKFEVKLMVEVLDSSGQVIKSGDRSPSVGAHSADRTRVSTKLRTIEAADAPKVRLRAAIIPK